MRRGKRLKPSQNNFKYLLYLSIGLLLTVIITFIVTFIIYNNKLKSYNYGSLTTKELASLVPNDEETQQASIEFGKNIEEVVQEIEAEDNIENTNIENNQTEVKESIETQETVSNEITNETTTETAQEIIPEPVFSYPVEGEIQKEFAKDTLIYSNTLEEWITHLGIDIKADRTTIVKASEEGVVTAIKNDPRYGLSVIIEHNNNFKTVYSNLLTTEFVTEGEKVEKGQAIGTIGNSATFEISDEPHLHFEIIKEGENVDPKIYINN